MIINIITYISESPVDIKVRIPQYLYPVAIQILCSDPIVFFCFFLIVLRAVQLNHQLGTRTIEINDITTNYFLFRESNTKCLIIIPKMLFLFGHILTQVFCQRHIIFVVCSFHFYLVTRWRSDNSAQSLSHGKP